MNKLISCLLAIINCLSGTSADMSLACEKNENLNKMQSEQAKIEFCLPHKWQQDEIIQISTIATPDFTYAQLIPRENRFNNNFRAWREIGLSFDEEFFPLGTNTSAIRTHYLYPLRYSSVEIIVNPLSDAKKTDKDKLERIISSMRFMEIHPFQHATRR